MDYGYDTYGDVTSLEDALGNTTTSNYNNLGWLCYVSDPLTHTTTYTDDNWGRVISTQEPNETVTHTWYDNDSNMIAASDGTVDSYTYGSTNKMTACGNYAFTYDANGNMNGVSSSGTAAWSYTYDCENRMVSSANLGSSYTDTNTYNGLGCRVANHDTAGTYTNQTDGVDATNNVLYDGVELFTPGFSSQDMTGGAATYYTEPDQIGTTLGMMNASQTQDYGVEYDAFGDIVNTSGTFTDTYAFMNGYAGTNGYQTEKDTGFIRCGNRFYSPYFGRFITQDPIGAGINWYAYCDNDPTGAIDPSGLYWVQEYEATPIDPRGGLDSYEASTTWWDSDDNAHPGTQTSAWVWVDDAEAEVDPSQSPKGGLFSVSGFLVN